ncbi:MAG: hypothetical protein H0V79_03145 [Actinobacteria bacterium]|nr:hypothetical protein [Actinomycetota bacterium]
MLRRLAAVLLTLLALGASFAIAATPADTATPCWKRLLNDWSEDDRIDRRYSAACIEEALSRVPEDIRAYSDFEEQARAAMETGGRTLQSSGGSTAPSEGPVSTEQKSLREVEPDIGRRNEGPIGDLLAAGGPNNADSVPLPLMILAALALALMTAGAAGIGVRKLKAQRASSRP